MTPKPSFCLTTKLVQIKPNQPTSIGIVAKFFVKAIILTLLICAYNGFAIGKNTNNPPVANGDTYSGHAALFQPAPGVLANDTDPDGDSLFVREIVTDGSHGHATVNPYGQGSFTYQPNSGYVGNDSFTYRVCDAPAGGLCATATVNLIQPNQAPTANNNTFSNLDARGGVPDPVNFLTDDSDPEGDNIAFNRIVTYPAHGALDGDINVYRAGRFIYAPNNQGYLGDDSFTYEICDSIGACSIATVTLVEPNRAPIAISDFYGSNYLNGSGVLVGFGSNGGFLANDYDLEGDDISFYSIVTDVNSAHGALTVGSYGPGTFLYTATNGYVGLNSFTYKAKDIYGATATGTVYLYSYPNDDVNNAGYSCPVVAEPVNVTNGNMWLQQTDYTLPGVGENIEINRFYNSVVQYSGLFGFGWSTKYDESLWFYDDRLLRLNMPDGRAVYFGRQDSTSPFIPLSPGTYGNVVKNSSDNTYTLTFKDGRIHKFHTNGKLDWQKDRNGNQTTLTYSGSNGTGYLTSITDAFGRTLNFVTNPTNGTVQKIYDSLSTINNPFATYEYDTVNTSLLKTITYSNGSQYKFEYDTTTVLNKTLLKTVKDANNNILETHVYDSSGRATTSERQGGVEKYTFDYQALFTIVTDANGKVSKYWHDKSKGRNVVTKAEGVCSCGGSGAQVTDFVYDNKRNLIKKVYVFDDPSKNLETLYTYDNDGNVLTQEGKVGTTTLGTDTITYNAFGQMLTWTDKMNGVTTNTYDANGNLKTTTDALGKVTTINYPTTNNKGLPESVKDARNNITKFKWNSAGLLEEVEDTYTKKLNYTYDARGRVKTVINALNQITTYNYFDDAQRKLEVIYPNVVTDPTNDKITYKYDVRRLLESVTDERGKITTYTFDNAYRLTRITDPLGHFSEFDYDLMSNKKWSKDGLGNQTDYKYDDFNRLKEVEYPAATVGAARLKESFEYDQLGRIKKATDTANRITNFSYDDALRTRTVTNAENEPTTSTFNARGQMIEVKDAKNQIYKFTYDPYGRILTQKRADDNLMIYEYDEVGNRKKRTDYMGRVTTYEYDNLNRLKKINYLQDVSSPTPVQPVTYTYDDISRLKTATNDAGTVSFNYDNRNRIKDTTDVFGHLVEYEYELTSTVNQKRLKFDGAMYAKYNYDDADRLANIHDSSDNTTISFGYDNADRLTSRNFLNGVTTTYTYDNMSRLTQLKDSTPTETLFDRQYSYNTASQIGQITVDRTAQQTETRTFGYDNVNRLLSMTNGTTAIESYKFDDVGNRTESHKSASYTYQSGQFNRVTSTENSQQVYSYDGNGNMVSKAEGKELWRYIWDYENRLTSASTRKQTVRYRYDALGRRVQRYIVGGKENTKFIYDGDDVLVDDNSGTLTKYLNGDGIDNKLRVQTGSDVKYFLTDHLGSTNALTDSSGNIASSASYDSFGNATGNLNTRYQFTGREFDNFTGLHYYRARWYDGNLGRFISEDPIGLAGGINTYGYVGNNPGGNTDPSGLYPGGQGTLVEELNRVAQSPEAVEFATMAASPEGRALVAGGSSAAVAYGGSALAYGGTSVAAAGAAPIAATVGVGLAIGGAIGLPIGNYTASLPNNPYVNGSLNPWGISAGEVEKEPWKPGRPKQPCEDDDDEDWVYHGTTSKEADDIVRNGLNEKKWRNSDPTGIDETGFFVTTGSNDAYSDAYDYAEGRALIRGGKPAVIAARKSDLEGLLNGPGRGMKANERYIKKSDFPKVPGGVFRRIF